MPDLSPEHVEALLASLDLTPQDAEDLEEITHRINAIREALAAIDIPELDGIEPMTIFVSDAAYR